MPSQGVLSETPRPASTSISAALTWCAPGSTRRRTEAFEEHMTEHGNGFEEGGREIDQRVAEQRSVPEATVARLAIYLRVLNTLGEIGTATVSSESLSVASGVNSATLRKDLSYLG